MCVTEIGARTVWSDDGNTVAIRPERQITIRELELMAGAFLAADPEPIIPAPAFVHERRLQKITDGTTVPVMVKVHPDVRVQRVLHELRENAVMRAMDDVSAACGGHTRDVLIMGAPAGASDDLLLSAGRGVAP
jgi:hypothetical protein